MRFEECAVDAAWVVEPEPREDDRGFFARSWCAAEFANHGITDRIRQVNICFSRQKGTLRGMHFQRAPHDECKVARCTRGSVFDVVLDLRRESPTYRRWYGLTLSSDNRTSLVIPEGCAHGFVTLEDETELQYSTSVEYAPDAATGVRWDDAAFGIAWPIEPSVISEQDRNWPLFDSDERKV